MFPPRPQQRTRLPLLDTAKVIAISLVILGHLCPHGLGLPFVRSWIYHFHMPLFFFISGYLHPRAGWGALTGKCVKSLLLPSLVWVGVWLCMSALLRGKGVPADTADIAWQRLLTTGHHILMGIPGFPCPVVWYCFALAWCRLMGACCVRRRLCHAFLLLYLPAVLCLHELRYLFLAQALVGFPYYLAGMLTHHSAVGKDWLLQLSACPRHKALPVGCCLLAVTLLSPMLGYHCLLSLSFGSPLPLYLNVPICYGAAFLGIAGVLLVAQACPFSTSPTIGTLSRGTLVLLCIHPWLEYEIFQHAINSVFPPFHEGVLVPLCCRIAITLLMLLLGLGVCHLLERLHVGMLFGYRAAKVSAPAAAQPGGELAQLGHAQQPAGS